MLPLTTALVGSGGCGVMVYATVVAESKLVASR